MKNKVSNKAVVVVGLVAVALVLCVCYMWPKSLYDIISVNSGEITSIGISFLGDDIVT